LPDLEEIVVAPLRRFLGLIVKIRPTVNAVVQLCGTEICL